MHSPHDHAPPLQAPPSVSPTEAALRESEALLRDAQEIAGVGSWRHDFRTGVTAWSDELYRIQGLVPGAVPPTIELFLAAVHPEDRERVQAEIRDAVEAGRAYAHDYRCVLPDGTIRTHHCRGRAIRGADGAVERVIGSCQDITERTHTADALRASEERLRLFLEQASDVLLLLDDAATFRFVSPAMERVFGHAPATLLGATASTLVHPDDWPAAEAAIARAFALPGVTQRADVRVRDADGAWRPCEAVGRRGVPGAPTTGVIVTLRDMTAWRAAEAARRAEEARFRALIEHAHDVVGVLALDGTILYESPAIERMLGYRPEELVGRHAGDVVHPDDLAQVMDTLAELAPHPGEARTVMYRCRHRDGSWRTLETGAWNLAHEPAIGGIVLNARDVTERAASAAALRASEERLRLALRAARMVVWELDLASGALRTTVAREGVQLAVAPDALSGAGGYATFLGVLHPEDRPRVEAAAARALVERSDVQADFRVVLPDGEVRWRRVLGRVLLAADGSPERMVGVGLDVTDRKALEEELTRRAHHDALTGLANRALFLERVAATLAADGRRAADGSPAVLLVDLDDFKRVNDSLGHEAGDRLLQSVTARLLDATRGSDTVARLGGDEFAILLRAVPTDREAVRVADRVIAALTAPHRLAGHQVRVGASVGIALAEREDDPDALVRNADLALYRAKALGKNRHATFAPAMHAAAVERLELETELRHAIEAGELVLQFQPIVALDSGAAVGAEALVRWHHPERGVIPPAAFVPLAESTGLIVPLGRWVLEEACRAARGWERVPSCGGAPSIAVNVSARQLQHHGFLEGVAAALRRSGLAPDRLVLEVTESVLLEDLEPALGRLEALRALGVRLALDDFGTGYSSLAYLQRLPVDVLKIDRTFTTDLMAGGRRAAVARAVVTFARTLGLRTVAEGIETPEQRAEVLALGCTLGQGFHFARPLDLADATAYLRAHQREAGAPASVDRVTHEEPPAANGARPDGAAVASVLVVDDEPAVRRFARVVLEGVGYRVLEAGDGAEALRRLAAHPGAIALVLTDVEMPELSGPALADALTAWAPRIRVLYMSGAGPGALAPFAPRVPPARVLAKPFTPGELRAAVESTLAVAG